MQLPKGKILRVVGKALVIAAAEAAREIMTDFAKKIKRGKK